MATSCAAVAGRLPGILSPCLPGSPSWMCAGTQAKSTTHLFRILAATTQARSPGSLLQLSQPLAALPCAALLLPGAVLQCRGQQSNSSSLPADARRRLSRVAFTAHPYPWPLLPLLDPLLVSASPAAPLPPRSPAVPLTAPSPLPSHCAPQLITATRPQACRVRGLCVGLHLCSQPGEFGQSLPQFSRRDPSVSLCVMRDACAVLGGNGSKPSARPVFPAQSTVEHDRAPAAAAQRDAGALRVPPRRRECLPSPLLCMHACKL